MTLKALLRYFWIALVIGAAGYPGIVPVRTSRGEARAQLKEILPLFQESNPPDKSAQLPAILAAGEYHFDQLTTSDGLSQSTITSILQDQQGFMWFGTFSGLNKYDGYTFTVYRNDPDDPESLRDDNITSLEEDNQGVIWVGTQDGWLERYDAEVDGFSHDHISDTIYKIFKNRAGELSVISFGSRDLNAPQIIPNINLEEGPPVILEDSSGRTWRGGFDGSLILFTADQQQLIPLSMPVENYEVTTLLEGIDGEIWVGRRGGGLSRYQPETGEITHFRNDPNDSTSLVSDHVNAIIEDRPGILWIGTSEGLDYFNSQTGQFRHFRNISGDSHSLSDSYITTLFKDRTGILWIGTASAGINKLDPLGANIIHFQSQSYDPTGMSANWVQAITVDRDGDLWVGTPIGLIRYDQHNGTWRRYNHDLADAHSLSNNNVTSLYEDREGTLWIGSSGALDRYDQGSDSFYHMGDAYPLAMTEDLSGELWVVSENSLYKFIPDVPALVEKKLSYNVMTELLAGTDGMLWIGTDGDGLWYYDGSKFRLFSVNPDDPNSLSSNHVSALYEDSAGNLWVGTSAGLNRFNRELGTFTRISVKDGLPNNNIQGILEDDHGYLWLSTLGGISRMDPKTGSFRNYEASDGLQSNDFNNGASFKGKYGELYFGGYQGFNVFLPVEIVDNIHIPPVIITKVNVLDQMIRKDLPPGEQITLPYTENTISFEFVALDYYSPEKNQYAYRMEGVDQDWVNAGTRRFAEYRNMQPGDYTFRVKGSNNDGVWNEEGASVQITITPPFWRTGWFPGIVILMILGITIGLFRLRVRSIEARSRELEDQVELRTKELTSTNEQLVMEVAERERAEGELSQKKAEAAVVAERNRLARDLHDSVTQSLYAVTLYSDAVNRLLDRGSLLEVKNNLAKLHTTAMEAMSEMRLLVFELHPPILEEAGLASAIQERLDVVERRSGKQVSFKVEGECELPLLTQEGLYRIAQEALNNILKHSFAQNVDILLRYTPEECLLEVRDDGIGFDVNSVRAHTGLGLRGMHERAKLLGGELCIESQPGKGTCIRIEIARDQ